MRPAREAFESGLLIALLMCGVCLAAGALVYMVAVFSALVGGLMGAAIVALIRLMRPWLGW